MTWDPGPRLNPLVAAIILFGPMSVVLASVSPIAVRLAARSLDRLGRTAGRLFSISTAGSIAGTFVTAFWPVPEYGTDQVLAVGAVVLLTAAAVVALLEGLWLPGVGLVAAAGAALIAVGALAPDKTGTVLQGAAARNWSPLYRERETQTPRKLDPAEVGASSTGFRSATPGTPATTACSSSTTSPLPPLRQLVPERHVPRRPVPHAVLLQRLPPPRARIQPLGQKVLVVGLGGGSVERMWRDFKDVEVTTVEEARPGRRRRGVHLVQAAARPAPPRGGRRRAALPPADGRALRRDHGRRLHSDGVPFHLDPRLRRADAGTPHARRGDRHQRDRRADRREIRRSPRALWKTYAAVFPTVKLRPVFEGQSIGCRTTSGTSSSSPPSARPHRPSGSPARERDPRGARSGVLTDGGREGQVGAQRRHRRRSPPRGRLRADRRAADRLTRRTSDSIPASR